MIRLAALLHRDHDLERPECGVKDGFVFGEPDDFPCRDAAEWRVAFHCPGCDAPYLRLMCSHHRRALVQDPNAACEHCLSRDRRVRPLLLWSTPAGAPLNPAYGNEELS